MYCLHCGANLNKKDILCLRCGTPVLTEDDITLMPNAVTTRYINEEHSKTGSLYKDPTEQERVNRQRDIFEHDKKQKKMKRKKSIIKATIIIVALLIVIAIYYVSVSEGRFF